MASMSAAMRPRPLHNFLLPPVPCSTATRTSKNNNHQRQHCFDAGRERERSSSSPLLFHSQFRIKNGAEFAKSSRVFDAELGRAAASKNFEAENVGVGGSVRFGALIGGLEEELEVFRSRRVGESKPVVGFRQREDPAAKIDECPVNVDESEAAKHDECVITRDCCGGDESTEKKWNLRPRRENSLFKRWRKEGRDEERCRKFPRLVTSLSKAEIAADFVVFTGSKPPKKPTRRPVSVQRELNSLYPGSQLGAVTADRYRVNETRQR
ncbi:hypothetical protein Droror1_Dr00005063 [Drosera rotundifolia]